MVLQYKTKYEARVNWGTVLIVVAALICLFALLIAETAVHNSNRQQALNRKTKLERQIDKKLDAILVETKMMQSKDMIDRINSYCKGTDLEGFGEYIVRQSIIEGIDPRLVPAMAMVETGCKDMLWIGIFAQGSTADGISKKEQIRNAIDSLVWDILHKLWEKSDYIKLIWNQMNQVKNGI